jgi:hypothetical protein
VEKNDISFNEFCDTPDIFMSFNDFKELFKKVRFEISSSEAKALFSFENRLSKEGYILMKNFYNTFKEVKWKSVALDSVNTDYDVRQLNNEFKNLHREVLEIVNKDKNKKNAFSSKGFKSARTIEKFENKSKALNSNIKQLDLKEYSSEASISVSSFNNRTQRESFYPSINQKDTKTSQNNNNKISVFLSQRLKADEMEEQRIKEDTARVSL